MVTRLLRGSNGRKVKSVCPSTPWRMRRMRRTKSNCLCIIWTSTWYLAYCNPSSGCTKSGPPPPLTIVVLCLNVHVGPSSTNHHVLWMHRERPFVHRGGNQICILFHCLDGPVNRRIPVKEQDNTDPGLSGCWTSEETHSPLSALRHVLLFL